MSPRPGMGHKTAAELAESGRLQEKGAIAMLVCGGGNAEVSQLPKGVQLYGVTGLLNLVTKQTQRASGRSGLVQEEYLEVVSYRSGKQEKTIADFKFSGKTSRGSAKCKTVRELAKEAEVRVGPAKP